MRTSRIIAAMVLIGASGLTLHVGQAQVGARRIDLHRHDVSVTGREVVQTIVELAPGTTAPRHTHPGEEIIYVLEVIHELRSPTENKNARERFLTFVRNDNACHLERSERSFFNPIFKGGTWE